MLKIFIKIRKKFWLQPKWRILRIYTKTLPRKRIEALRDSLKIQLNSNISDNEKAYLRGKLEIVKLLLDEK